MYAVRTPTNPEFFTKILGYVAVIVSSISLSLATIFIAHASHVFVWVFLVPISIILLFVGWEMQIRAPRQSINYPPVLIITCLSICTAVLSDADGLLFISIIGLIVAFFLVPVSTCTTFASWRDWRNSEGSTRGRRSSEPVVLNSGVIRPQATNYSQKFRAAEEIFDNACFKNEVSYLRAAQRAPVEWHFDRVGASDGSLSLLRDSLHRQPRREWDILVLLVSALPEEPQQPAVIVVTGTDVDKILFENDAITLQTVGFSARIAAVSIRGMVCYRW